MNSAASSAPDEGHAVDRGQRISRRSASLRARAAGGAPARTRGTGWRDRAQTGGVERYTARNTTARTSIWGDFSTMATDYDSPRKTDDEMSEDSLEELKARRQDKSASTVDVDEADLAESLELPGADLSNEELSVRVLPRQADEFTCSRCFLVHHRSQLAKEVKGQLICKECAA